MALELWPFTPSPGVRVSSTPRVKTSTMGDGYEQRKKDGLNSDLKEYSVDFVLLPSQMDTAREFLDSKAGVYTFLFYSPTKEKNVVVVCSKWNEDKHLFFSKLSATFSEMVK